MTSLREYPILHAEKTFIGRVERGFDFLGNQFEETGLVAFSRRSLARFRDKVSRRMAAGASGEALGQ